MTAPIVKRWVLSPHALGRVQERKVSARELASVIEDPDVVVPQGPKWIFAKTVSGRSDNKIAAVLLEREDHGLWVVVTVMVRFDAK